MGFDAAKKLCSPALKDFPVDILSELQRTTYVDENGDGSVETITSEYKVTKQMCASDGTKNITLVVGRELRSYGSQDEIVKRFSLEVKKAAAIDVDMDGTSEIVTFIKSVVSTFGIEIKLESTSCSVKTNEDMIKAHKIKWKVGDIVSYKNEPYIVMIPLKPWSMIVWNGEVGSMDMKKAEASIVSRKSVQEMGKSLSAEMLAYKAFRDTYSAKKTLTDEDKKKIQEREEKHVKELSDGAEKFLKELGQAVKLDEITDEKAEIKLTDEEKGFIDRLKQMVQ